MIDFVPPSMVNCVLGMGLTQALLSDTSCFAQLHAASLDNISFPHLHLADNV